jgi:predicted small lipoprotein YifL
MKRIKRSLKTQLFLVAMVIFLAACGQRGPLYLPEPEQEPVKISETEENMAEENEAEANETGDDGDKTPGT